MTMGFLGGSPPPAAQGPSETQLAAERKAAADAKREREDEEDRKREEQKSFASGLRGQRALLSSDFTGFDGRGVLGPSA
jgi:hypothetical protein